MQLSGKTLDSLGPVVWLTCTENGDYMEGVHLQVTKYKGRLHQSSASPSSIEGKQER